MTTKEINKKFSSMYLDDCTVCKQKYFLKTRSPFNENRLLRESNEKDYTMNENSFQAILLQSKQPNAVLIADNYGIETNNILLILDNHSDDFEAYVSMKFKNQSKQSYQKYYKVDKEASLVGNNLLKAKEVENNAEIALIFSKFEEKEAER